MYNSTRGEKMKKYMILVLTFFICMSQFVTEAYAIPSELNLITKVSYIENQWQALDSKKEVNDPLKGISIVLENKDNAIQYRIKDQTGQWSEWYKDGMQVSVTSIQDIEVQLIGEYLNTYELSYRLFYKDLGWKNKAEEIVGEITNLELTIKEKELNPSTDNLPKEEVEEKEQNPSTDNLPVDKVEEKEQPKEEINLPEEEKVETPIPFVQETRTVLPTIFAKEHIQNIGWTNGTTQSSLSVGTTGRSLAMEALELSLNNANGGIDYSSHVANIGWMNGVSNGVMSGTTGRSLGMQAIKISLTGEIANTYDIYYRAHVQNTGWLGWTSNGNIAGSTGESLNLEALEIKLLPKNTGPANESSAYYYNVKYKIEGHVQNVGWQERTNAQTSIGTSGQSLRLEAIALNMDHPLVSGDIVYRSHVQNIGWQDSVSNGKVSGTTGQSLRLEAIQINLTGQLENTYDIYYRAHVQNEGWLGWTKNGGYAGTEGYSLRLESIEIKILPKNSNGPSISGVSFKDRNVDTSTPNPTPSTPNTDSSIPDRTQNPNIKWGIDISEWQNDLKLGDLRNELDYAILRIGYTGQSTKIQYKDFKFDTFYNEAKLHGIPIGGYYYSVATNVSEAIKEANYVLGIIRGKKFEYPIYFDFEDNQQGGLPASQKEAICNAFCLTLKNGGYVPGVYSRANFLFDGVSDKFKSNWDLWVSHYGKNNGQPNGDYNQYKDKYEMWQFTSKGNVPGYKGSLDVNICYYDYPSDIKNSNYNGYSH